MRPDAPTSSAALIPTTPAPGARPLAREVRRRLATDASGEPVVELVVPRVVGPGRLERGYRARIERLEGELADAAELGPELELARLVERGAQRRLDRVERDLGAARREARAARDLERRLCAALGALQRENALLAEQLDRHETRRLVSPRRRPLLARLFGTRR